MKYLALIASSATLLCCGLPALLVLLGFGAVVASVVSAVPAIVVLSEYKLAVFGGSACVIILAWILSVRARVCVIDERRLDCETVKRFSRLMLTVSSLIWILGFSVAFILPRVL